MNYKTIDQLKVDKKSTKKKSLENDYLKKLVYDSFKLIYPT